MVVDVPPRPRRAEALGLVNRHDRPRDDASVQEILRVVPHAVHELRLCQRVAGHVGVNPRLEQEFERPPTPAELAEVLDMTLDEVKQSLKNAGRHVSMDAPLKDGDDSSSTMYDVLQTNDTPSPDTVLITESLRKEIERSLQTLTSREADVVRLYFGLGGEHPLTLEEIGERFDLTRERVRQIKEKAIRRLKHTSRSRILKSYLG